MERLLFLLLPFYTLEYSYTFGLDYNPVLRPPLDNEMPWM